MKNIQLFKNKLLTFILITKIKVNENFNFLHEEYELYQYNQ